MKVTTNFDGDSLKKEIMKKAKSQMKENFKKDIQRIARPFDETPKIIFKDKGSKSISVTIENVSDELKEKIDKYVKSQSK